MWNWCSGIILILFDDLKWKKIVQRKEEKKPKENPFYCSSWRWRREKSQALWSRAVGSKVTTTGDRCLNIHFSFFLLFFLQFNKLLRTSINVELMFEIDDENRHFSLTKRFDHLTLLQLFVVFDHFFDLLPFVFDQPHLTANYHRFHSTNHR